MLKIRVTYNEGEYAEGQTALPFNQLSFLQSYQYGQMQGSLGHEPFYMVVENENGEIVHSYLAILFNAKRGRYLFLPYPVIRSEEWDLLLSFLKTLALQLRVDFLRISPLSAQDEEVASLFRSRNFRPAPIHMMHPEILWLLDLSKNEQQLLKGMRKNTRYAIKQAENQDIKIHCGHTENMLELFYKIHLETAKRQHFVPYPYEYLKAELEVFGPKDQVRVYLAEHQGQMISGAVILFYGQEGVYHHGASLPEFNKIFGSYLIQWEAIKEAQRRGLRRYNFFGIVEDAPKHPWAGLSFFKKGFGGEGIRLMHCQDLPLTWKYWFNFVVETVRRMKRGY